MSNTNQAQWMDFYKEFAAKLLPYKENRAKLIAKVKEVFERVGTNLPRLEKDNNIVDIDPFTVFGLFNKNSMKDENRKNIIRAVAELFGVSSPVPVSFKGVPTLNNLNATFYHFIDDRADDDMDNLWRLFQSALDYAASDEPTEEITAAFSKYFNVSVNMKGNGSSKITMGLYWIAPDTFLNLDRCSELYIYTSNKIPLNVVQTLPPESNIVSKISAADYLDIVSNLRGYFDSGNSPLKNFVEMSCEAWRYSEEVNKENREKRAQRELTLKNEAVVDGDVRPAHYWIYSPGNNADMWDEFYSAGIMGIGWGQIGDLMSFNSKDDMKRKMQETIDSNRSYRNDACATWQFAHDMQIGDVVFAKKGLHLLVGRGIVESDYIYDDSRQDYKNIRRVKWTHNGQWTLEENATVKTLTDITSYTGYVEKINALFATDQSGDDGEDKEIEYPPYTEENFLEEVYMDKTSYDILTSLVRNKKNVILQGAPGVGKTFIAKRLAYAMMGVKDTKRVAMIQFHQSYSYEDFIMGFRPSKDGFELRHGAFYSFCKRAEDDSDNDYFFIIDEINRGNLSKILGELFMLIESDKRGMKLSLLYSDEKFSVPSNVYIIGTMNTADRSLAMLDYALRRRFAFYTVKNGFDTAGFKQYQQGLGNSKINKLIECVKALNAAIASDDALGEGFCIGHSYFCHLKGKTDSDIEVIVRFEIIPLLEEYWFDEKDKLNEWRGKLLEAIR